MVHGHQLYLPHTRNGDVPTGGSLIELEPPTRYDPTTNSFDVYGSTYISQREERDNGGQTRINYFTE